MNSRSLLLAFAALSLVVLVESHGRLTKPIHRSSSRPEYIQNAPVAAEDNVPTEEFVCRGDSAQSSFYKYTANSTINIQWDFTADHNGDCFIYVTYDSDKPIPEQNWFKIEQYFDCKSMENKDVALHLPSYLPSSAHVIFRFEWYALHVRPKIEFYAQCWDASIQAVGAATLDGIEPKVKLPHHLPADGTKYRDSFTPSSPQFITGPEVAKINGVPYVNPNPTTPTPTTPTPTTPTPTTPTPTSGQNEGSTDQDGVIEDAVACTTDSDCSSGVCKNDGFCYNKASSGIGAGGIAAIVLAAIIVVMVGALAAFLVINRKEVPAMVPFSLKA